MSNKILKYIKNPGFILYRLDTLNLIRLSDEKYLKLQYKLRMNKKLNLEDPQTFNEKLQWLKLHDRKPQYTNMVDKYEAKKYVADKIGQEFIIPTLGVWENADDINFDELPNQFVLKCTHDSGGIVICKNKAELDIEDCKKKLNKFLKINFYYSSREWPYKNIKPRIIAEKYITDESNIELKDYKFFCFNGTHKYTLVCSNRFENLKETFFDKDWNLAPFKRLEHDIDTNISRPQNLEKMIELAQTFSKNIPFVRVDFYNVNGKIYFGEFTFSPATGMEKFEPDEWDKKLGSLLVLPTKRV